MAKLLLILFATIGLQTCISAAPNANGHIVPAVKETPQIATADPKQNRESLSADSLKVTEDKPLQGQRQKRFYDYFDFDLPAFVPYNNNFLKRDNSQNTGVHGTEDFMLQILRRVQTILSYTRQQALSPPVAHYPVPSFIPLYYIPQGCDCTPAETPSNGVTDDARPTQPTTPVDSTTQGTSPANEPSPSPTDDTNKTSLDFSSRLPVIDDEGDGARPISFVPVKPKTPLKKPPPPVEHGSSQASSGNGVKEYATTTPPPIAAGLPAQAHLPTDAIPTLCDGAVLTCCHRAEITYDCFKSQGCPNPTSPDTPCDENLILEVIRKFQYYYANRRG